MNKQETYEYLDSHGISYEVFEHTPVYTVREADALGLPHPELGSKNLFLRDDKKKNYYLLTLQDQRDVDLKEIRQQIGSRRLSFASETDLHQILGLQKGSVTPLGLLNDTERKVRFYLDSFFQGKRVAVHPNENTATVYLNEADLMRLLREHGTPVDVFV